MVSHNLGKINRALQIAHELGMLNPPLPKLGPWKLEDEFGAGPAIIMTKMLHGSRCDWEHRSVWDSAQDEASFFNLYQSSVDNISTAVIGGKDGKTQLVMGCPFTMVGMTGQKQECIIGLRQGGPGLRFFKKGGDRAAGDAGRGIVGSAIGGR
jgi:hypothetical protein